MLFRTVVIWHISWFNTRNIFNKWHQSPPVQTWTERARLLFPLPDLLLLFFFFSSKMLDILRVCRFSLKHTYLNLSYFFSWSIIHGDFFPRNFKRLIGTSFVLIYRTCRTLNNGEGQSPVQNSLSFLSLKNFNCFPDLSKPRISDWIMSNFRAGTSVLPTFSGGSADAIHIKTSGDSISWIGPNCHKLITVVN